MVNCGDPRDIPEVATAMMTVLCLSREANQGVDVRLMVWLGLPMVWLGESSLIHPTRLGIFCHGNMTAGVADWRHTKR